MFILRLWLCALLLAGCATKPAASKTAKWKTLATSDAFKAEKEIYFKRLGANFCWGTGVSDFLASANFKPDKGCLYPSAPIMLGKEDPNAYFDKGKNNLQQSLNQLRVLQVVANGFIVESPKSSSSGHRVIFIHKTDESRIVDGSYLDDSHSWNKYEYAGPYSYGTKFGPSTVHSFRKVPDERFAKANEGLNSYTPKRDMYISYELWDYLDQLELDASKAGK